MTRESRRRRPKRPWCATGLTVLATLLVLPALPQFPVLAAPPTAGTGATARPGATARTPYAFRGAPASAVRTVCGPPYVSGDRRLGPRRLPRTGALGRIVRAYVRFGGIPPKRFLHRYWDGTATPPGWRYPPDDGFAHAGDYGNGRLLRSRVRLRAGAFLDRFGSEFGSFLAPRGTPYAARALPPDSLDTRADDPAHLCNYHVYRVIKAFDVAGGPAAPAFQQHGRRPQYRIVSGYLPGGPTPANVRWLVDNGYLRRVR